MCVFGISHYVGYKKYVSFMLFACVPNLKSEKDNFSCFLRRWYVSLVYHSLFILTCSAKPRARSEFCHIDDFYSENLPSMTMNALSNDTEWSPATIQTKRQH